MVMMIMTMGHECIWGLRERGIREGTGKGKDTEG
jgi:hypothetical protein